MGGLFAVCALIGAACLGFTGLALIYVAWSAATSRLRRRQTEPHCISCGQACAASEPFCQRCKKPREWVVL